VQRKREFPFSLFPGCLLQASKMVIQPPVEMTPTELLQHRSPKLRVVSLGLVAEDDLHIFQ
jgi:hypothetical protein